MLAPMNALLDPLLTAINTTGYLTANVLVARRVLGKFGFRSEAESSPPGAEPSASLPAAPELN
jgi:hypothetical protein